MMKRCTTSVLEQGNLHAGSFATEPFEAGWAGEARWFVRILNPQVPAPLTIRAVPQISPDGILWCDQSDADTLEIPLPGHQDRVLTTAQKGFGNWVRLRLDFGDASPAAASLDETPVKFLIYLVLKE